MSQLSLLILVIDPLLDIHLPVVGTYVKLNVHLNNEAILFFTIIHDEISEGSDHF